MLHTIGNSWTVMFKKFGDYLVEITIQEIWGVVGILLNDKK